MRRFLVEANSTCEWMWSIYRKFALCFIVTVFVGPVASVFFSWLIDGILIVDHFYRPVAMMFVIVFFPSTNLISCFIAVVFFLLSFHSFRLPWSQVTIFGYFSELILITIMCAVYSIINGVILLLFISICIHHRAFYQIIRHLVIKWNELNGNHCDNNDQKSICELIRLHILFKE